MNDRQPSGSADPRVTALAAELSLLDPADQDLVRAIVARLRAGSPAADPYTEVPFHDPDVPFMDFDE